MEALNRIPKILETVEQMNENHDIVKVFESYKKNVRIFIASMKEEVSSLIKRYQATIHNLTQEISNIKANESLNQFIRTPHLSKQYSSTISPTKGKVSDIMQTTNSNVSTPFKLTNFEDLPISSIYKKKRSIDQSRFPDQLIKQQSSVLEKSQSKFEQSNKKRKQRQQQLRLSLQSGKKNLNVTTDQYCEAIGRNASKKRIDEHQQELQRQQDDSPQKGEQSLNKSLGQICEALDTSFIAKKARSQKKKTYIKIQEQIKRKQQIQKQTAKLLKDKGLKSLLQRLRKNVETSPYQVPDVIRSSRLIAIGEKSIKKDESASPSRKSSKVMINPVPVDIARRSKATSRSGDSPSSPQRKPQSILKRSSTVLSRSISGINFNDLTL